MDLNLLVRKFIMPDGPWIWSSLSESSLCPTVHLSEALSVRKFNMPDGPWIGSCWSESLLCHPSTVWHNKLSDQELQIHEPSDIINFLTKSFRFINRRASWTLWPRDSDSSTRKFIMSDGSWIWSSWSESSLCPTVHEYEALGQKVQIILKYKKYKFCKPTNYTDMTDA
jgi:hypothetical protein